MGWDRGRSGGWVEGSVGETALGDGIPGVLGTFSGLFPLNPLVFSVHRNGFEGERGE